MAPDAKVESEIGAAGDLGAIFMDRPQPTERPLHEADRRQQHAERSDVEGLQNVNDEAHVMIMGNPADMGRLPRIAEGNADHLEIFEQVAMADDHPFGSGGGTRSILQKGSVAPLDVGQSAMGRFGSGEGTIDKQPLDLGARQAFAQIRPIAGEQIAPGHRKARRAIGENGGAGVARAAAPGDHHRHGDDPGENATKEGNDEIQAWRKQQRGTIAFAPALGDPLRDRACAEVQLGKGQSDRLATAIRQKDIGEVVGPVRRPDAEQVGEGADCDLRFLPGQPHGSQPAPPPSASRAARCRASSATLGCSKIRSGVSSSFSHSSSSTIR